MCFTIGNLFTLPPRQKFKVPRVFAHGLILALLLLPSLVRAGTFVPNSCAQGDVNACVNGTGGTCVGGPHTAVNGDVIAIPACASTNWSTSVLVPAGVGITITGAGTPNNGAGTTGPGTSTTTLNMTAAVPFFEFQSLTTTSSTARVTLLNLNTTNAASNNVGAVTALGICTTSPPFCPSVRFDNITFGSGQWAAALDGAGFVVDNVFGVADHNSMSESPTGATFLMMISFDKWQGVGTQGYNSFASADTAGTAQSFFMENNSVSGVRLLDDDVAPPGGGVGGPRYVCRFNQMAQMSGDGLCGAHGTAWGGPFRGQRQVEVYYNTVSSVGSACDVLDGLNSGTGYFLSNTAGFACNAVTELDIARLDGSPAPVAPWFNCDGTSVMDPTPWSTSSFCLDQPGHGAGVLYTVFGGNPNNVALASSPGTQCTTAGQCPSNAVLDPVYEAGEVTTNNAAGISVSANGSQLRVLANRDYYAQVSDVAQTSATSPFNGTSGTGYGTLARRPTTCTTGVGYWATDQGTWNTYNSSQEGTLYICTVTNTWTSSYVPYTYPHPLDSGSGGGSTAPSLRNGTSKVSGTGIMR